MKSFLKLWCVIGTVTLTLVAGCSGGGSKLPTHLVLGTVTLDGAPLEGATVNFEPVQPNGVAATGTSAADGTFKLTSVGGNPQAGAIIGDYKVSVNKWKITTVIVPPQYKGEAPTESSSQVSITPVAYRSPANSPITVQITKGKNEVKLALVSTP